MSRGNYQGIRSFTGNSQESPQKNITKQLNNFSQFYKGFL